jgi:hypothetical protein
MLIRLFDIQNGKVTPSEHCYTFKFLKQIMDDYPQDYLKIYQYLFYMTCPQPDINPCFNIPENEKEDWIMSELEPEFSLDDEVIIHALHQCRKLYETATSRAYFGMKVMLDNLADYMHNTPITHGRDGNVTALVNAAAKFEQIRQSFKGVYKDLVEEQQSQVRGGKNLGYDQM